MRLPSLLFLALLIAFPSVAQSPSQQPQTPSIQISVNRVNVGVIVTDAQGNFVPDLRSENFHIFDDGGGNFGSTLVRTQRPACSAGNSVEIA